jgi:hypothetical protein
MSRGQYINNNSLLLAEQPHEFQLPFFEELEPVFEILVEHFDLLVLVGLGGTAGGHMLHGLDFEDLVLDVRDFGLDHFILGHQVAVDVLLIDVLLGGRVLYEELLQILQLDLQGVVVIVYDHVVLLGHFPCVAQLLVLVFEPGHLELVLLNYLVQRYLDLCLLDGPHASGLFFLLHLAYTQGLPRGLLGAFVQRRQFLLLGLVFGNRHLALGDLLDLLPQILVFQSQQISLPCEAIDDLVLLLHLHHRLILYVHCSCRIV